MKTSNRDDNLEYVKVSVIIPTYRKFDYLLNALDSVFSQNYPNIELIISDDGSENIEVESIISYIAKQKKKMEYKIVRHSINVGTVRNMNSAILESTGEFIIPLSYDDEFASDKSISLIVNRFIETSCNILVCSRLKCSSDLSKELRLMPHPGYIRYINKMMDTAEKQYKNMAMDSAMEFASGASMYYRRSFFDSVGGYDERYLLWEDGPFIAKVTRLGYKIETAYDIVSIRYREGGISSKGQKNGHLSKIEKDYCSAIENEYLSFPEKFSDREIRILKERYMMQSSGEKLRVEHVFKCPLVVIHIIRIKLLKFGLRYL